MPDTEPGGKATPVYTIGYGGRSIEAFITVLQAHEIAYLIDVRSAPYSRFKPEFSKEALQASLRAANIRYIFMGDSLGGRPNDAGCYDQEGKVLYQTVETKAFYQQGIGRLWTAFNQGQRIVLMCSEGKPEMCHRSKLIGKTLSHQGIPIAHIDESDEVLSQDAVLLRLTGGQLSLFGDQEFTSRKRYQEQGADSDDD